MHCVFVTILVCLIAPAHPNDSMDKLGDKLAATLTKSVDKLGDTLAHSVDKLGDTLVDRVSDRLAGRAFNMQSPDPADFDNTVHAKPGAANLMPSPARQTGFQIPSLTSSFLHAPMGGHIPSRPLQHGSKANVGRVDLRDLYNPVHTVAEAKALAGKGLGYHVRPPAPLPDFKPQVALEGDIRSAKQEARMPSQGFQEEKMDYSPEANLPFKFSVDAPEFHPGAFRYTSATTPDSPSKFSPHSAEFAPEAFKPAEHFVKSSAEVPKAWAFTHRSSAEFAPESFKHAEDFVKSSAEVPKAWAFTHPKNFQSPKMSSFDSKSAILGETDMGPTMIPAGTPPLDIDSIIDRDIRLRKTVPGKHSRFEFSANAPEFAFSQ